MPLEEDAILTISIAANLVKLHPRTVMLYEKEGLFKPHRTNTKRRLYSKKNIEELQFIKYLTQTEGINIPGSRKVLEAMKLAGKSGIHLKPLLFPYYKPENLL